jgi:hypothetical protein
VNNHRIGKKEISMCTHFGLQHLLAPPQRMATVASALEVSVKDYAARGDGKTDDRLAIQAAIDAVSKAGGAGLSTSPTGIYLVTAPSKSAWTPQIKLSAIAEAHGIGHVSRMLSK